MANCKTNELFLTNFPALLLPYWPRSICCKCMLAKNMGGKLLMIKIVKTNMPKNIPISRIPTCISNNKSSL